MEGIDAADHDEFAHIPSSEGKDKARKKLVSDIFGITGDDEQTKGEVHCKGECRRECQDVHQTTFFPNAMRITPGVFFSLSMMINKMALKVNPALKRL
jgi:hypothetical protein